MRRTGGLLVVGVLLFLGSVATFMALADACAEYGSAWCFISPAGDGYTPPYRGEP